LVSSSTYQRFVSGKQELVILVFNGILDGTGGMRLKVRKIFKNPGPFFFKTGMAQK